MYKNHRDGSLYRIREQILIALWRSMLAGLAIAPAACAPANVNPMPPRIVGTPPTDYSAPADAPFTAEEIMVPTPMGHILAGTLTLPKGRSASRKVGAIVTASGTGPQDRDEFIGVPGYRPFRQIADSLARRGIAVLRMDDRGVGKSTGTFKSTTDPEFAEDIRAGLAYLRTRSEIDTARLGLLGHSEGALIAPLAALHEPSLRALVLLAGAAHPLGSAVEFQLANAIRHDTQLTPRQRDSALATIPKTVDSLSASDRWWKFLLAYDPSSTARQLRTPAVLIMTGATDQQADPTQVPDMAAAFRAAGNTDVTTQIWPNLNHLFAYDPDGYPGNYGKLPSPVRVDPSVIGAIADWLADRLK